MRIEDEIKLTFDDVLIRPKRSTLVSRSEVHLERSFKFKHTESIWNGVPIVSANMDTTGTFETAIPLSLQYSRSMWSYPVERVAINLTFGNSSRASLPSFDATNTTSTSKS